MNSKRKFYKEEIESFVKESKTIADVCRKCGWVPRGDNYKILKRYFKEYNIDISHFIGQKTNIGNVLNKHNEIPVDQILQKETFVQNSVLKKKIFVNGIKEYKCEICGCNDWMGKFLRLQIHHINGDNSDNRIENLQILCPNCHSQTENFCGKNIKIQRKQFFCSECNKEIYYKTITGLCLDCYKKTQRNPHRPEKNELLKLILENSFSKVGKLCGVTSKTISKWCKQEKLPYNVKTLKEFKENCV